MSEFCFTNKSNYLRALNSTNYNEYFNAFHRLIHMYLTHFKELHITTDNKHNDAHTLTVGLEALVHIFGMLLLNTKNLKFVNHHCEKTIFYYFEFIQQMTTPKNNIQSFLQLTVHDAKLFIYKKTIHDLLNLECHLTNIEKKIFNDLRIDCNFFVKVIAVLVSNTEINNVTNVLDRIRSLQHAYDRNYLFEQLERLNQNNSIENDLNKFFSTF